MKNYFSKIILGAFIFSSTMSIGQTSIKFLDQPCIENCSSLKSINTFKSNQSSYINFSIDGIKKIALKPTEVLMIKFKFYEELSSFEEFTVLAKQNENGIIHGESLLLGSTNQTNYEVNTIFNKEFNFRLLEKLKNQSGGNLKLHIEKYFVMVYDVLKQSFVSIDYGVYQEDIERFKQFINIGSSFDLNKYPSIKLQCESSFPFDEINNKTEVAIRTKKEILYNNLANKTTAPKEFLLNDFNGISGEITREIASKTLNTYFNSNQYNVLKISKNSNQVNIEKGMNEIPKYKWFYIFVFLKDNTGKCGYAPVTMKSDYQGGGKYANWRVDLYKWTSCPCE